MSRKDSQYRGDKCLNCNTPLDISERYCHYCGQLNSTKKLTLKDFFDEFLSNFYAYDSKIRNSIVCLFTQPGMLAKRFISGQRTYFANPFRLFLSISLILFLSMAFLSQFEENEEISYAGGTVKVNKESQETTNQKIPDSIIHTKKIFGKETVKKLPTLHPDSIYTEPYLIKAEKNGIDIYITKIQTLKNFKKKHPNKTKQETFEELDFEDTSINNFLYSKSDRFRSNDIYDELEDLIIEKLPFLIFLSIPLIALSFWLVFHKRELNYTDHLIFTYTFYSFVFLFLLLTEIISVFSQNISDFIGYIGFFILLPYYLYRSLRNFYNFGRWKTILKFVILHPVFFIVFILSILMILSLGIILI